LGQRGYEGGHKKGLHYDIKELFGDDFYIEHYETWIKHQFDIDSQL